MKITWKHASLWISTFARLNDPRDSKECRIRQASHKVWEAMYPWAPENPTEYELQAITRAIHEFMNQE